MKKVIYLLLVLAFLAAGIFFLWNRWPGEINLHSPNILLITIDTLRPDHLSCYGSSNHTPNIDAIAGHGLLFENAFSQVPLTLPSHTSILTGLFPVHHGVHQNGLEVFKKKESLVTQQFRKAGYRAGAVVSSFVLDRKFGLAEGFDQYDDQMERLPGITSNFEVERSGDQVLWRAEKMLNAFEGKKWFLWLHFYDPHTPYAPPAPFNGYDGEIQFVDQQIGKLRNWLKQKSLDRNLIIVLMGDHGESLGEHGEATHGFFVYNSTIRIPLILSYPGAKARKIFTQAAAVDVAPTLLQLSGIHDPQTRDGQSLSDLIREGKRKSPIYFESRYAELVGWNGLHGLIQQKWKFISTTRSELYDWEEDPHETKNLYSQREDLSRQMKVALDRFGTETAPSDSKPDTETLEKLESLGYVGAGNAINRKGMADPKDKIAEWAKYEESLRLKSAGKIEEAIGILELLIMKEPTNNFIRISLATAYRQTGQFTRATEQLQVAIKNDPSDAAAYHELALAYKDQQIYQDAIRAEQAALTLRPDRTEFHNVLGLLFVETGRFQEAKSEFDYVLKTDSNNAVAWNNLGNALREKNQLNEAADAYRKAIELSPHYAYPLNGLGTVLIRQNQTRAAIPLLEKAIDLDPKFVEVYLNLGIAYHSLHETEKAKTLYMTFLKLAPPSLKNERESARMLLSQIP